MSNINDLCAKCHRGRWRHTNPRLPGCHVFVEPAPQPAPRGVWTAADIARGKALADGYKDVLPDAAPSGEDYGDGLAGGEGLGCDQCMATSPTAASSKYRLERAVSAGWFVDEITLCPRCRKTVSGEVAAPRPAPSGDEAKAREIAEKHMAGYGSVPVNYVERAALEAYAAGKADGAREERSECEKLIRARANVAYVLTDLAAPRLRKALHDIADAIARRGSEGK